MSPYESLLVHYDAEIRQVIADLKADHGKRRFGVMALLNAANYVNVEVVEGRGGPTLNADQKREARAEHNRRHGTRLSSFEKLAEAIYVATREALDESVVQPSFAEPTPPRKAGAPSYVEGLTGLSEPAKALLRAIEGFVCERVAANLAEGDPAEDIDDEGYDNLWYWYVADDLDVFLTDGDHDTNDEAVIAELEARFGTSSLSDIGRTLFDHLAPKLVASLEA